MASSELNATVLGLDIQGQTYENLLFRVIPNLCADVVPGPLFLNETL